MPACSVFLVTLFLSEAGPGHFGRQLFFTYIYHTIPYTTPSSTNTVLFVVCVFNAPSMRWWRCWW